jgi:hypothetical protein
MYKLSPMNLLGLRDAFPRISPGETQTDTQKGFQSSNWIHQISDSNSKQLSLTHGSRI